MKTFYRDKKRRLYGKQPIAERMNGLRDLVMISKGKTVLDIGCAEGLISNRFAKAGAEVTGIDKSKASIKYCMRKNNVSRFKHVSIQNYQSDNQFDIVLLLSVLQKLGTDDQIHAFVKAVDLTKEYIAVRVPENHLLPFECIYPMELVPISHHHDLDSKRVGITRVFRKL